MKYIFTILILSFLTIQSFAQRSPDLKIEVGLPYVFGNDNEVPDVHTISGFPSLSVEKPIAFGLPKKKKYSINPGVSYFFFKESEETGNLSYFNPENTGVSGNDVVSRDFKLNHHSLSIYSKWLYQAKLQRKSEAFLYFGVITALHVYTKTKGDKMANSNNETDPYQELKINESGKDFFGFFYYGALAGFQPNAKYTNVIKPSFEVKFYPGLVKRRGEIESSIEVSVLLGLRQ